MLNVTGRRCLVVGAGQVGLRRAEALIAAGASVVMVSPRPPKQSPPPGAILFIEPYRKKHLAGCRLAFACTDDAEINSTIARDARSAGVLVNVADRPEECDFYVPAMVNDGEVVVAIGTGGASPGLAGRLRGKIQDQLPPRIGDFAAALRQARTALADAAPDRRKAILQTLADDCGYNAFVQGGPDALLALAKELLSKP